MSEQLKTNVTSSWLWVRFVYMLLFSFFLYIASFVVCVVVVVQFLFCLVGGKDNRQLRRFANSLSQYIKDALMFLTFNSEYKPFPFADWPEPLAGADEYYQVNPAATASKTQSSPSRETRQQEGQTESVNPESDAESSARTAGVTGTGSGAGGEVHSSERQVEQDDGADDGGDSSVSRPVESDEDEASPKAGDEPPKPKS